MIIKLEDIDIFAQEILERLTSLNVDKKATVVFLNGDLGSGKTTTIKTLAKKFGIQEDITSPTFVILKRYDVSEDVCGGKFKNFIHVDAYRLKNYEEIKKIKFEEYLSNEKNIIFIEWPEMIENKKLVADLSLNFSHNEKDDEREVEIV